MVEDFPDVSEDNDKVGAKVEHYNPSSILKLNANEQNNRCAHSPITTAGK
jgi:hypothetical protein